MNASQNHNLRNVNIHFDAYGEDDPVFKADLIVLMIDNVRELLEAAGEAYHQKDSKLFSTAVHKTKSTINLLNDPDLFVSIESIREAFNNWSDEILQKIEAFRIFVDVLIRSLEHEAALLKAGR
jgi:hypothetical protein